MGIPVPAANYPRALLIQTVLGLFGVGLWATLGSGRQALAALVGVFIGGVLGTYTWARAARAKAPPTSPGSGLWSVVQMEIVRITLAVLLLYAAIRALPDAFAAVLSTFALCVVTFPIVAGTGTRTKEETVREH